MHLYGQQCPEQHAVSGIDANGNLVCVPLFVPVDADGDGVISVDAGGTDCDDSNSFIYPGAQEICDSLDNDCNGVIDDKDIDGDGYIDVVCGGGDCNDSNYNVNPGADELCTDGLDNNCDGVVNEGCSSSSSTNLIGTGTFIVPTGVTAITVELWGGGGGGGGSYPMTFIPPCPGAGGGGGGSGGYSQRTITVQSGDAFSYNIGSAGIGGIGHGSDGGQSSFIGSETVTAGGGQGGLHAQYCDGGAGGGGGYGETLNGNDGESPGGTAGGSGGLPIISPLDGFTGGGAGGVGGLSLGVNPFAGLSGTNGFGIVSW